MNPITHPSYPQCNHCSRRHHRGLRDSLSAWTQTSPARSANPGSARAEERGTGRAPRAAEPKPTVTPVRAAPATSAGDTAIGKGERVILTAVAQYDAGVTREQLTVLTGYKRSSRDTYLQRLKAAGLVESRGTTLVATTAAYDVLGDDFEPLPTGQALRDHWIATLPEGERRILDVLLGAYPSGVLKTDLDEVTGYKRSSRDTYLQRLRARQLVTTDGDPRAADTLFEEARRG